MTRDNFDETVRRPLDREANDTPAMSAQLRVVFPQELAATVPLTEAELVLGRRPGDEGYALDDPTVSRKHFAVRWEPLSGCHVGVDLDSRNGSRVEGLDQKGEPSAQLSDGDVIRMGDVLAVYETGLAVDAIEPSDVSQQTIPGDAAAAVQLRAAVAIAAKDPSPVLLIGETGVGKEFIARELHRLSGRAGPLVAINCAALSPQLIESQLFGHAKGAFTGAQSAHEGLFRSANGGTVFLDEVGELPLELQPKLLRVLQEREVHPVGETRTVAVDVRIVSATLRDLTEAVELASFRLDLYARLSPWEIRVPSLRQRRADLLSWIERLYQRWHAQRDRAEPPPFELEAAAAERVLLHDWNDNLRGLDRIVHRACADPSGPKIDVPEVARTRKPKPARAPTETTPKGERKPRPSEEELRTVLDENEGSVRATAKHFERDRRQIYRWMEQYGLREKKE